MGVLIQMALRVFPETRVHGYANAGYRIALMLVVNLLVTMQVWFMMSLEGKVQRAGRLKVSGGTMLTAAEQRETTPETMPL